MSDRSSDVEDFISILLVRSNKLFQRKIRTSLQVVTASRRAPAYPPQGS